MESENKRFCSHCGKELGRDGYVIEGGREYYCSDACLDMHYTEEEYLEMYDGGDGDTYWTEFEDDCETINSDVYGKQA